VDRRRSNGLRASAAELTPSGDGAKTFVDAGTVSFQKIVHCLLEMQERFWHAEAIYLFSVVMEFSDWAVFQFPVTLVGNCLDQQRRSQHHSSRRLSCCACEHRHFIRQVP
jgi:hypothetical protein